MGVNLAGTLAAPDADSKPLQKMTKIVQDISLVQDPILGPCWAIGLTNGERRKYPYIKNPDDKLVWVFDTNH